MPPVVATILRVYTDDARVLGLIGTTFRAAGLPSIRVTVPAALAERAVAAWEEDGASEPDDAWVPPRSDDPAARLQQRRAGALALIGLSITESGKLDADGNTVVDLSPELVGVAMDAASDHLRR
ncbi:hypothetical protein EV653_5137 [Kribbella pratensis]|uniref:Uncharacterized protein n=1 Tax=Kribbella pratensis TaxID=2512112 RepID=A0A4V3GG79_9ACTN|nr:hypothetical protein EV653_5137 [Kribbella pratensis]